MSWSLLTAIAAMAVVMLVFVHIMTNRLTEYDIRTHLRYMVSTNLADIDVIDGNLVVSDEFEFEEEEEGFHYLVMNQDNKILAGEYGENGLADLPKSYASTYNSPYEVEISGEHYFIYDKLKRHISGKEIFVRGIAKYSEVSGRYSKLKYLAYLSIFAVAVAVMAAGRVLARKISTPLAQMREIAEKIGKEQDSSQRISYEGNFKDLSILAQAENRMLDQMEQMMLSQEQFASNVTHELRTPVSVIMAESRYGCSKADDMEEMRSSFEVIHRQSKKMSHLIRELLYLAKLEQGRQPLEKELSSLPEIVKSICEEFQEESSVKFELDLENVSAPVNVNLIIIAFQNLISNAVKFSPPEGIIRIRIGETPESAFLSVADEGEGISKENVNRIFERFYKEDSSRQSEGFGLGLAIAMKIAKLHGGTIEVESTPGKGSTFCFRISKAGS